MTKSHSAKGPPVDAGIIELMTVAGVDRDNLEAFDWLRLARAGAQSLPQPGPRPAEHNAPLRRVEKAAAELLAALVELRRHPHAFMSFWRFRGFGPVFFNQYERAGLETAGRRSRSDS